MKISAQSPRTPLSADWKMAERGLLFMVTIVAAFWMPTAWLRER